MVLDQPRHRPAPQVERFRPATLQETVAVSCEGRRHRSYRGRDLPPIGGGVGISFDAALGSAVGSAASIFFNTTATAAAGARVVVVMSYFQNAPRTAPTCTIGGTAATLDKDFTNGVDYISIFSRVLVGSLASGSNITVSMSGAGGFGGVFAAGCSYLGTTGVDTNSSTNTGTTAAAWSTGAASNTVADALYVAGAGTDGTMTSESSTPSVGNERFDLFFAAANQGMVFQDFIASSIASTALTGTWGTTAGLTTQTMALVIYKGAASAAAAPFGSPRLPFMAPQGGIL